MADGKPIQDQWGETGVTGRGREVVYGRHPVSEVLAARRRRVHRLWVAKGVNAQGALLATLASAEGTGVLIERVPRKSLDQWSANHQGVAASVDPYPYVGLSEILERAQSRGEPPLILLLDVLQDPQNLGTLLRTAEAVGVHGVVLPHRRGVGVTPAVVSASSGACEHLLVAQANLAQAIRSLKGAGVWIAGLEKDPEAKRLDEFDLSGSLGLVVGNEGRGLRELVRRSCDLLVRIPLRGQVDSLNAAVAGSIALYAAWAARGYRGDLLSPEHGVPLGDDL